MSILKWNIYIYFTFGLFMNIGDRLKVIREHLKLSQNQFVEVFNIKQATLSKYERNDLSIPDELKMKLMTEYNINLNWLLTGQGSMFLDKEVTPTVNTEALLLKSEYEKRLLELEQKLETEKKIVADLKDKNLELSQDLIDEMRRRIKLEEKNLNIQTS